MDTCFENIIGFTRTDCSCFTAAELGADYKKSNSGLFMDELPETEHILKAIKSMSDCGKGMADHFGSARRNAISEFKDRVFIETGTRFTIRQNPYTGIIGQTSFNAPYGATGDFIAAAYEMKPLKGGKLKVNRFYLSLNQTVSVKIKVYKAYVINGTYEIQGAPLATIDANSVANTSTPVPLESPLELPLTDDSSHILHYLFVIDRSEGFLPMNNTASCGCANQTNVERWLTQGSLEGNDFTSFRYSQFKTGKSAPIMGIVADVEIKCNDTGFVCENYNASPFIKAAVDKAIQFEAGSNLLKSILRSDDISRYALTKREQMATDAAILHNKFKSRVTWIAENLDLKSNNCFVCNTVNESYGPYKTGIIF